MGIRCQITFSKRNHNVKILGRRLCSPSLEDVAWLEDSQLILLIFPTFVYFFSCELRLYVPDFTDKYMEN